MGLFGQSKDSERIDFEPLLVELGEHLREIIRSEAAPQLTLGRATETLSRDELNDPVLRLEPKNSSAAPLEISVSGEYLLTCAPGRNNMVIEMFSKDQGELEEEVRGIARAVLTGQYVEQIKEGSEKPKVVAKWGQQGATLNVFRRPSRNAKGWHLVTYEPY